MAPYSLETSGSCVSEKALNEVVQKTIFVFIINLLEKQLYGGKKKKKGNIYLHLIQISPRTKHVSPLFGKTVRLKHTLGLITFTCLLTTGLSR